MTQSGPADMKPEGPTHLVARSWRRRMVGFPIAAAGTPPYPPLGTDARDSPVLLGAALLGRAPTFTELDSPVPSRGCSGAETVRSHLGSVCGSQCGSGPGCRLASAVKSQLLLGPCAIRPGGRLVPAQPSSGRLSGPDQAPCGQAGSSAWKLPTRPTLSAHARTSRQACMETALHETALQGNRAI